MKIPSQNQVGQGIQKILLVEICNLASVHASACPERQF